MGSSSFGELMGAKVLLEEVQEIMERGEGKPRNGDHSLKDFRYKGKWKNGGGDVGSRKVSLLEMRRYYRIFTY